MTTVAVIGASRVVGQALLERLDADPSVDRIIAVDSKAPQMPVAKLVFRPADVRDALLALVLEGADVVVHLAMQAPSDVSQDTMFALCVRGTHNVLRALERVRPRRLVVLSSAAVYGAHPDNPIPLTESSPARANPDFPPSAHAHLAEERVGEWAAEHTDVDVVVLRSAAIGAAAVDTWLARHLESPRLPLVRGHSPPFQFVHVDDVASALHLATTDTVPAGVYNVAADGWLAADEASRLLGRRVVELPEEVAFALARRLWRYRLVAAPPGLVHFLMHPLVVSADRLRALGWAPVHSNRDVLREFAAAHDPWLSAGRVRVRRRNLYLTGFGVAGACVGVLAAARAERRRARASAVSRSGPQR